MAVDADIARPHIKQNNSNRQLEPFIHTSSHHLLILISFTTSPKISLINSFSRKNSQINLWQLITIHLLPKHIFDQNVDPKNPRRSLRDCTASDSCPRWIKVRCSLFQITSALYTNPYSSRSGLKTRQAPAAGGWWLGQIQHQGIAAFNKNPASYPVFRNVKDYGAKGDGVTDDTDAINAAIQAGGRCMSGCDSSTTQPGLTYFPSGTYLVSKPIIAVYYSQLVGDAANPPTLKAAGSFAGMAVIDADPYNDDGSNWYTNQNK